MGDNENMIQPNTENESAPYAIWYIEYNANGGSGAPARQEAQVGQPIVISEQIPTKTGYTFVGWSENMYATEPDPYFTPGKSCPGWGYNIVVYAIWQEGGSSAEMCTLHFDLQGGTASDGLEDITRQRGTIINIPNVTPTKNQNVFLGWGNAANENPVYTQGASYTLNSNATLYAIWKQTSSGGQGGQILNLDWKPYGIKDDGTLGTNMMYVHSRQLQPDELNGANVKTEFQLGVFFYDNKSNKMVKRKPNIMPGIIDLPDSYMESGLYAMLSVSSSFAESVVIRKKSGGATPVPPPAPTYTVSYNANAGSDSVQNMPKNQVKQNNVNLTLSSNIPTRDRHIFEFWAENADGSGTRYNPGSQYTRNASATLYAKWMIGTWGITYDANGGTGAPARQTAMLGSGIIVSDQKPTKPGHTFLGWSKNRAASEADQSYTPGKYVTSEEDIILYAVWKTNTIQTYTIEYDANGGYPTPQRQIKQHGVDIRITSDRPELYGSTFMGWARTRVGQVEFSSGDLYTENANLSLFAIYQTNDIPIYTITYNANGGQGSMPVDSVSYNTSYTTRANAFEKPGYTFTGWNEDPSGNGTSWTDRIGKPWKYTYNRSIILYAQWTAAPVQTYQNMYIGSGTISSAYIGSSKISEIYIGTNRIL